MRFKYYLRGIGIGIITATLIMMIAIHAKGGLMSDDNAIKRAKELGYTLVESGDATGSMTISEKYGLEDSISGNTVEPAKQDETSDLDADDSQVELQSDTPKEKDADKETDTADSEDDTEDTTEADDSDSEAADDGIVEETVVSATITVTDNDGSESVSRKLADAGIVENADSFNKYLINNGYATKLQNGKIKVSNDMSYDKIAEILIARR